MYFLTLDKIFVFDNFSFVQDKKCFVQAEGRGIRDYFAALNLTVLRRVPHFCPGRRHKALNAKFRVD